MLVDPYGRRLIAGQSPLAGQGRVEFLVEVADPVSDAAFSYTVNGVRVSDFYTPRYFDPQRAAGVQYSYGGHLGGRVRCSAAGTLRGTTRSVTNGGSSRGSQVMPPR